jgi:hypothetical protein
MEGGNGPLKDAVFVIGELYLEKRLMEDQLTATVPRLALAESMIAELRNLNDTLDADLKLAQDEIAKLKAKKTSTRRRA